MCLHVTLTALETEDHLILTGVTDSGKVVDGAQCRRLFDLPGEEKGVLSLPAGIKATLEDLAAR